MNKLPINLHPAEIKDIACADLHRLASTVGALRRELSFLNQDVKRVENYGKSIVLLLDFSELYTYLWPEKSSSQYKILVRHLLTNSNLTFTLAPGAVRELIYELSRLKTRHGGVKRKIDKLLSKPLIEAFLRLYKIPFSNLSEKSPEMTGEVMQEILHVVKDIRQADVALDLLVRLYDSGRLKSLTAHVDTVGIIPTQDVLYDAYLQLISYRPYREDLTNYIDAYNYAYTYELNNRFYEKANLFFLLVTSSRTPYRIFETIKWKEDPLFKVAPSHLMKTSLVRNPAHMLFLSYFSGTVHDKTRRLDEIMTDLEVVHKTWSDLPIYRRYISDKDVLGSTKVELPVTKRYVKHISRFWKFYQDIYRPITELMAADAAQEQNRRRLRRVDASGVGSIQLLEQPKSEGEPEQRSEPTYVSYRSIIALFDRLQRITEAEIGRAKKSLTEFRSERMADLDPEMLVFKPDELSVGEQPNEGMTCTEITVKLISSSQTAAESIYLCADRYEDYISFWWRTNIDFSEFLKACRHFVRGVVQWQESEGSHDPPATERKEFNGVYFHLADQVVHFSLEEVEGRLDSPLHDDLLSLCESHWDVRFVRIGLDYCDLCYDLQPVGPYPQRAGIVTHLRCGNPIADLVQWTHQKYAHREALRRTIRKIVTAEQRKNVSSLSEKVRN